MQTNRTYRGIPYAACLLALTGAAFAQTTAPTHSPAVPDCGHLSGQTLTCGVLGFTYGVPYGWVDRTDDMQNIAEADPVSAQKNERDQAQTPQPTGRTLLAVFERPPGTPGEAVNPAVVIAAEDRDSYPQVKTAADYLGALADIAAQRGLKMTGDPYIFAVGEKQLARGDFISTNGKTAARQTSLVLLQKRYILSFTFLSASDDEIDELIANLTFATAAKKASPK